MIQSKHSLKFQAQFIIYFALCPLALINLLSLIAGVKKMYKLKPWFSADYDV